MKKFYFNIVFLVPFITGMLNKPVLSGVYDWKTPTKKISKNLHTAVLFEGSAFEMEWIQMGANILTTSSKAIKIEIPVNEEELYIVRKGILEVTLKDSSYSLSEGSTLVLFPGEKFSIQNNQSSSCTYFIMKYRSHSIKNEETGRNSFVRDWKRVEFKPHERGGVRSFFERPTAMLKRMEMHVTTLNAGLSSHDPHRHLAKEIIVIKEGNTEMKIGESNFKGKEGSVYFIESNVLHGIRNIGTTACTYYAIQFE